MYSSFNKMGICLHCARISIHNLTESIVGTSMNICQTVENEQSKHSWSVSPKLKEKVFCSLHVYAYAFLKILTWFGFLCEKCNRCLASSGI